MSADRQEAVRQAKFETKQLPPPDSARVVDQIEILLGELQAEGVAVEIREQEDGSTAIVIVRPEHRQIAARLAQAALPPPGSPAPGPAGLAIATFLSARIARVLESRGIRTAGELATHSAEDLLSFDSFGKKSLALVRRALDGLGLRLRGE
jgi:hypothetical protein